MKRKTVAILVCTCLVLSACADNKKEVESDQTESYQMSNNLIYYNLEDIIAFAVDGTDVWTIKENENKIKGRRASGGSERSGIPSDHERKN